MSNRHRVIDIWGRDAGLAMAQAAGSVDAPDWRGVLEGTTTAVTQCNRVIGSFVDKMPCYICGLPILAISNTADENRPECEHILPVAEARWYLDLFSTSHPSDGGILKLEYAYAHRVCNQAKRDDSFVKSEGDSIWKIEFDEATTKTILNKIKARATTAIPAYETKEGILKQISSMSVAERSRTIQTQKIAPILREVNSKEPTPTREDIIKRKFGDDRLAPKVLIALTPFKDPKFQERKENEKRQADAFYQDNDVLRIYDEMILLNPFNNEDDKVKNNDEWKQWKQSVLTMMAAKKTGLLQDWFSILFFSATNKDGDGTLKGKETSIYANAFEAGRVFVEFRIKLEAYRLLPYISDNTRSEMRSTKCDLLDYFRGIQLKYNNPKQPFKMTLKQAGIFVRDDEIKEAVSYSDLVLCKKVSAEELTRRNREESGLRIAAVDDDGPVDKFEGEEVFFQPPEKSRGKRPRPASAPAAEEGLPEPPESRQRTRSLGGKTARRSVLSKMSRRTRRRHRNRSKGFGKQTYRRRLIK